MSDLKNKNIKNNIVWPITTHIKLLSNKQFEQGTRKSLKNTLIFHQPTGLSKKNVYDPNSKS